uniref:Uncharacterized protein n=1 Tax=Noccaea caerulescens TaxID=107243 RepID=A0A1J3HEY8_NOCCA
MTNEHQSYLDMEEALNKAKLEIAELKANERNHDKFWSYIESKLLKSTNDNLLDLSSRFSVFEKLLQSTLNSFKAPTSDSAEPKSQTNPAQEDPAKEAVGKSHEDSQKVNGDATNQKHEDVETIFEKVGVSDDMLDSEPLRKTASSNDSNKNIVVDGEDTETDDSNSSQGDILIDTNDQLHRDFLLEIFSENTSAVHSYPPRDQENEYIWSLQFQEIYGSGVLSYQTPVSDYSSLQHSAEQFSQIDGAESSRLHHVTPSGQAYRDGYSEWHVDGTSTILSAPVDEQMKLTESEESGAMVGNLKPPDSEPVALGFGSGGTSTILHSQAPDYEPKVDKADVRQADVTPPCSVLDYSVLQHQARDVAAATTAPSQEAHLLPSRRDARQNIPAKPATHRDAVIVGQVPLSSNEDQLLTLLSKSDNTAQEDPAKSALVSVAFNMDRLKLLAKAKTKDCPSSRKRGGANKKRGQEAGPANNEVGQEAGPPNNEEEAGPPNREENQENKKSKFKRRPSMKNAHFDP